MPTSKSIKRIVRHNRIRAKVSGTIDRPRLSVFKSNTAIYAQVINDDTGTTIATSDSRKLKVRGVEAAKVVGTSIATLAKAKGVEKVAFDRGGFIYTGQIKTLAEAAREGGLQF